MSIISYAQNFEDVMLWRALGHIEHGFYVDVGAQDPTIDSVSLAFHEHGWRGIHVEPTPHYAEMLRQQRPGDTVIQVAVGPGPAPLQFFEISDTGISTADPVIAEQHRQRGFTINEITVTSLSLEAILEKCPEEIHWLKIDVEGFEQQVLSSWGKSVARPWILVVESTLPLTQIQSHESWEKIILGYGYSQVYFDGLNRFYVSDAHAELKAAFSSPPNVFDGFTLNGTASAPFHRLIEARCQEKISAMAGQSAQQVTLAEEEAQRLSAQHRTLTEAFAEHQQNWIQAEQKLSEQNRETTQALEALRHAKEQRELEVNVQRLTAEQQAHENTAQLLRNQLEQERTLHGQYADREQAHQQKLQALQDQLNQLQQAHIAREDKLHSENGQVRQEIEKVLRAQIQRDSEITMQLHAVEQQAQQEHARLVRDHNEQARSLRDEHVKQEKIYAESTDQTQRALENLLRQQVEREQEMTARLVEMQRQAEQEKSELERSQAEQTRTLHLQFANREQLLKDQLLAREQTLGRQRQSDLDHAQEITSKLLTLQQHAAESAAEQTRLQREHALDLHIQHTAREAAVRQKLQAKHAEVLRLEEDRTRRERETGAQLLELQKQAAHESDEQAQKHSEQMDEMLRLHAEREQFLQQQLHAGQQLLQQLAQEHAQREKEYAEQSIYSGQVLEGLVRNQAQREHEINEQLLRMHEQSLYEKNEHARLKDALALLKDELQAEIQSGHHASTHLNHMLAEVQRGLDMTHASLSWRMTSPLRKFTALFSTDKNQGPAVLNVKKCNAPELSEKISAEFPNFLAPASEIKKKLSDEHLKASAEVTPLAINSRPLEPTISPLVEADDTPMPNTATNLPDVLVHYDQDFVHCAYLTLLGRTPDPEGLNYYLSRLRQGYSKIQILAQLRLSKEGNSYSGSIPGLDEAIKLYQRTKIPLIGWFFSRINDIEGNSAVDRKLRSIENQVGRFNIQSNKSFNNLAEVLSILQESVTQYNKTAALSLTASSDISHFNPNKTPDALKHFSPRTKDIYLKIKTASVNRTGKVE